MVKRSENIVNRLFDRERCSGPPSAQLHRVRRFYENIVPSHTVYDVECPDHVFRKFTNDGQYLVAFSRQDLIVYRFNWFSYCLKGRAADLQDELPPKSRKFESVFTQLYCVPLASGNEAICKDFFLTTENSGYGLFATSTGPDADAPSATGAVPGVPSVEKITILVVRLADGEIVDERVYTDDFIRLDHNMGIFMYEDLLAILSVRFQCIHIMQIRDTGRFVDVRTVGEYCRDDDELLINSQAQREASFQAAQAVLRRAKGCPAELVTSKGVELENALPQWENPQVKELRGQYTVSVYENARSVENSRIPVSGVHGVEGDAQFDGYFRGLFGNAGVSLENRDEITAGTSTGGVSACHSHTGSSPDMALVAPTSGTQAPARFSSTDVETVGNFLNSSSWTSSNGRVGQYRSMSNPNLPAGGIPYASVGGIDERRPEYIISSRQDAEFRLHPGHAEDSIAVSGVSQSDTQTPVSSTGSRHASGVATHQRVLESNPLMWDLLESHTNLGLSRSNSAVADVGAFGSMTLNAVSTAASPGRSEFIENVPRYVPPTSAPRQGDSRSTQEGTSVQEQRDVQEETPQTRLLCGIKQRLLSFIFRNVLDQDDDPLLRAQRLKRFYYHFQHYVDLVMWKVQFLDRYHLLIKFGSVDGVVSRSSDASQQTAFFVVYNFETTEILEFQQNSSEEFLQLFENFADHFRVTQRYPLFMSYITSYSNNSFLREQIRKQKAACNSSKASSYAQIARRTLASLPVNSQSQSPSVYFDHSLFHFDEKLISATDRHKLCMEHPIKFISRRRPNALKFKINPGPETGANEGRIKKVAAFIFHPIFPFAISIQQSYMQAAVVNFHFRK